jgi:hypothetical protein
MRAGDRRRRQRLCRYLLRPTLAQDALELTAEGRVLLRLSRPCATTGPRGGGRPGGYPPHTGYPE